MTIVTRTARLWRYGGDGGLVLRSLACGRCLCCVQGRRDHCRSPLPEDSYSDETRLARSLTDPDGLAAVLRCSDAVLTHADAGDSAAVIGGTAEQVRLLTAVVAVGGVRAVNGPSPDPAVDSRSRAQEVRASWMGGDRYDIVVSLDGDLELAAMAVRRGGRVAVGGRVTSQPRIGTLVQREVAVIVPRDVMRLARERFQEPNSNGGIESAG
jgi:hypothetical protein